MQSEQQAFVAWEDEVISIIEDDFQVTRSDAQGFADVASATVLSCWRQKMTPKQAAVKVISAVTVQKPE